MAEFPEESREVLKLALGCLPGLAHTLLKPVHHEAREFAPMDIKFRKAQSRGRCNHQKPHFSRGPKRPHRRSQSANFHGLTLIQSLPVIEWNLSLRDSEPSAVPLSFAHSSRVGLMHETRQTPDHVAEISDEQRDTRFAPRCRHRQFNN